jgi:hypothetical protein
MSIGSKTYNHTTAAAGHAGDDVLLLILNLAAPAKKEESAEGWLNAPAQPLSMKNSPIYL